MDTSEKESNYARINLLLVKGGTMVAKRLFLQRVKDLSPPSNVLSVEEFLYTHKAIILNTFAGRHQEQTLYPCDGSINVDMWDLNLLCFLLKKVCDLPLEHIRYIETLHKMKNNIVHLPEPALPQTEFETRLEKLKVIFQGCLSLIHDKAFEDEINALVAKYENEPITMEKLVKFYHDSNQSQRTELLRILNRNTLTMASEHSEKLDVVEKKLDGIIKLLSPDIPVRQDDHVKVPSLADKWNQKCNRPPKEACRHDGRLILLSNEDISEIKAACTQEKNVIGRGGFGTVYKQRNEGFGMSIAIKKIVADIDEKKNSARKEMLASRILHPFILPLLSVFEDHAEVCTHFYFISPYCEKGSLYSVLEECRKNQVNSLKQMQRIRIALQLALAIQYLHTPVPNVRGIILHKDISSSNVVLDNYYNARLIDFGLAREKDDMTTTASGNVPYLHPNVGKLSASVFWDYYALGVVIRELLTGLPPSGKENVHLRCMSHSDIISNLALVWPIYDDDSARKANTLNTASQRCLDAEEGTFEIKIHVIDEIKAVLNASVMDLSESNKCVLCMINPDGSEAAKQMKHQQNCRNTIRLCIACEKNSFLNPVACYWCSFTLKPIIGSGWGALLVAGNDTNSDENANAFKSDMEKMRNVFTSRAPLVMGIREEHIKTVALKEPGRKASEEQLLPLVVAALEEISKMDIHTLVVYFSCHGGKNGENFFQLASKKDYLTLRSFQEMLSQLKNVQKIIVMLDRCFADKLTLPSNKVIVQLNSCGRDEGAPIRAKESLFTKYLIKGLQAKTHGNTCEKDEKNCKYCEDYWATRNDYITVERLLNFVSGHMEAEGNPKPRCYVEGSDDDVKLAYYTDEEIFLEFIEEGDTIHDIRQVPVAFCQNLDELKMQLFNNVDEKDIEVCIKNDTFRKENRFEICDTIDKVMMAWVLRKRLIVQLLERGASGGTTVLYQRTKPGPQC